MRLQSKRRLIHAVYEAVDGADCTCDGCLISSMSACKLAISDGL